MEYMDMYDKVNPASSSSSALQRSNGARKRAAGSREPSPVLRRKEEVKEDSPEPELDDHYVTFKSDVVGVQYYHGLVGKGEMVMLRRQPNNQYDPNAVLNANNTQVGHIPRQVAAKLAPFMDSRLITVEGRMIGQNLDRAMHYKLGLDLSIYARPSHRDVLEPELAWATPGQRGFEAMRAAEAAGVQQGSQGKTKGKGKGRMGADTGLHGAGGSGVGLPGANWNEEEMKRLLDGLKKVQEDEKQANGVMDTLTSDIDVSKLPFHPSPPGIANGQLHVDLLGHQSQALQWMIGQEHPKLPTKSSDPPVQFWLRHEPEKKDAQAKPYWLNVATRTPQSETPTLGRGGIIADGMGLGKTLTVLSLVLATIKEKDSAEVSGATLIVCPLSVLSNWQKQITDHVANGKLSCYTYHAENKAVTPTTLASYDVVLTTYQTVAGEIPADKISNTPSKAKKAKASTGPLFGVHWKRIVADEGHVLKNPRTKTMQAFAALQAERRWIATGTPIVNSPGDLGSLLTCLRVCKPLDQPEYFKSLLLRPLKNGNGSAGKLLQALVAQTLLRRTKDSKDSQGNRLVSLPPIEYFQVPVQLDDETRALYDEMYEASRERFQEALRTGGNQFNVLSMLTRMRQLCLSASLVPQSFIDEMRSPGQPKGMVTDAPAVTAASMPEEKRESLIAKLKQAISDEEECAICFDILRQPKITDCGHPFCAICIDTYLSRSNSCPMCRHNINANSFLEVPPEVSEWVEPDDSATAIKSAKIAELVRYLKLFNKDDKTLVFSQFTSFLDHVATSLKDAGIQFCRFDGSMNPKQRQEVIARFQKPVTDKNRSKNPVVMLISLKSGAVGLNLTAASNVFLCDPWWQSAIEAQAIDRVHRMGQTKPVRVFQLIAENTVESRVLDIQKRKDDLVAKAFEKTGGSSSKTKKEARYEDLKELLGVK